MYGKLRKNIRENIRKLCKYKEVEIIGGSVSIDHVHLIVKIPPKLAISKFMGCINDI
jgi:putative transposase